MSLKFMAIGDIHIADRHMSITEEALSETLKIAAKFESQIQFIVVMGDILDRHKSINMFHLKKAVDFLQSLAKIKSTFVLIGNHDRPSNKDFMSGVHPFVGINCHNLVIVSSPRSFVFTVQGVNHNLLFMPYLPPGRFIEAFNTYADAAITAGKWKTKLSIKDFSLIFAHQEFKGAPIGPIRSVNGDDWPSEYPMVISGHIHCRVRLPNEKGNIYYTGSLYPVTFSEGTSKGALICQYEVNSKNLHVDVWRTVKSMKVIKSVDAKDSIAVLDMISMDRENTKYVISGTADEISSVKEKVLKSGKKLNIGYDICIADSVSDIPDETFDQILAKMIDKPNIKRVFERLQV